MAKYSTVAYWNERYTSENDPFDWYQRWTGLRLVFDNALQNEKKILHLGCGNSRLAEEMLEDHKNQEHVNIDISEVVIRKMIEKHKGKGNNQFIHMDALRMTFPAGSFDVAIDKATLDTILCADNSIDNSLRYLQEVYKVLKANGKYLLVTFAPPDERIPYLRRTGLNWRVDTFTVPKPSIPTAQPTSDEDKTPHFIYICTKGA
jgi:ubiquinone/menaquinone biosynthesis C-methylase UbiE